MSLDQQPDSIPEMRLRSEEERSDMQSRVINFERRMAKIAAIYVVLNCLASIPMAMVMHNWSARHYIFSVCLTGFGLWIIHIHSRRRLSHVVKLAVIATMLNLIGQAYHTHSTFQSDDIDYRWFGLSLYYAVLFLSVNFFPKFRLPSWYIVFLIAISGFAVWPAPRFTWALTGVFTVVITSILIRMALAKLVRHNMLTAYRLKQSELSAARKKIETELELARKIHESFSIPEETQLPGGLIAHTFQTRHSEVGGDWAMIRRIDHQRSVVLVADATGKGLQAALVIHALQSLWARSLEAGTFDARSFLDEVNGAMLHLGVREPHSLTVGLLEIFADRVVYWSAGHVPLFVLSEGDNDIEKIRSLISHGNPIGLSSKLSLQPYEYSLPAGRFCIFMGTDGIFDKGTRFNRRDAKQLLNRVREHGKNSLDLYDIKDDKTLIWIRPDRDDRRKTPRAS